MSIKREDLDKRICDVEGGSNTETFREFIRNSEKEFDFVPLELDEMNINNLNQYLELINTLWTKKVRITRKNTKLQRSFRLLLPVREDLK